MGAHAERMKAFERGGDNGKGKLFEYDPAEVEAYERGWSKVMVEIWREKMVKLKVTDTGTLLSSLRELVTTGKVTTIEHQFMRYGLYVAAGVGPAHVWKYWGNNIPKGGSKEIRENGGNLLFLSKKYREEHGLDKKKKVGPAWGGRVAGGDPKGPRDWFFKKYYYSLRRLNLTEAQFFGRAYQGMMSSFLDELFTGGIRSNRF